MYIDPITAYYLQSNRWFTMLMFVYWQMGHLYSICLFFHLYVGQTSTIPTQPPLLTGTSSTDGPVRHTPSTVTTATLPSVAPTGRYW